MSNPQLKTVRLHLRMMRLSDLDYLLKIFGDPKVMVSFDSDVFSREQMQHWVRKNMEHQNQYGYGLFSVILKSESILIGDCGIEHKLVGGALEAELGYDFRSDYWNQGFTTEAASAVRDYAFKSLHLPRLISLIRIGNRASRRVAEKIGMRLAGKITQNGILYWKYSMGGRSSTQE